MFPFLALEARLVKSYVFGCVSNETLEIKIFL